jgi:CO dehydrogenase maturation factor
MKIAFVGKGGSGKSTLAALTTDYLSNQGYSVLVLDADINMHMGPMLASGVDIDSCISLPENRSRVREILLGTNAHIGSAEHFVKTTPPGAGSHVIRQPSSDPLLDALAKKIRKAIWLLTVGTYDTDTIGTSCYHGNLAVAENIVSHTHFDGKNVLVCDMVAGTDAFSGSLHLQFDCLFLVVEPTVEGVEVFRQYRTLAAAANVFDRVFVIGNKVDDEQDLEFLSAQVGDKLIACLPNLTGMRKARQAGKSVSIGLLPSVEPLQTIVAKAESERQDPDSRLKQLHQLHDIHAQEDYIVARHGDIRSQVDPNFSYTYTCQD